MRREFLGVLASAASWPCVARGQRAIPVIGFLGAASPQSYAHVVTAFRQGLKEVGYCLTVPMTLQAAADEVIE